MIKIGLIGCGHMGRFHAAKLKAHHGVEFVGCQDVVYERAEQLATDFNCKAFKSMEDIFGKVSAVLVAVPTQYHAACSVPFLENKIAVLVEKPIATDITQAELIVEAAAKSGAILQIGHSERFNPVYQVARPKIIRPRFIETHRLAPFKGRGHDVAVIYDLMIHDIDLLLDLTGAEPSAIEAAGVCVITETFDIVNARLSFPTGCVANVTASRISVKEMRKLRVFQQSGYMSIDLATRQIESFVLTHTDSLASQKAGLFSKFNLPDDKVIVREDFDIPQGDNLQNEINSFIEAVMGVHPPVVSGKAGLSAMRVAEQIEKLCLDYQKNL